MAAAIAVLCSLAAGRLPMLRAVELRLLDWRLRSMPPPSVDEVLIVGIENSTLSALPAWGPTALDRSTYARVIYNLARHGARAIAVDVYFGPAADAAASTRRLADAIKRAGNVVIVADAVAETEGGSERLSFTQPAPELAAAAAEIASPLLFRPDNVVRWVRLAVRGDDGRLYHALSFAAYAVAKTQPAHPLPPNWPMLTIRWSGPSGTVPKVKFEEVYRDKVSADRIRGRVVFVGRWDPVEDLLQTPLGPMNGVEIHAQAAADLLAGRHVRMVTETTGVVLAVTVALVLALLTLRFRPVTTLFAAAVALGAWAGASYLVARQSLVLLPMTGTGLTIAVCGVVWSALRSERALRHLRTVWPSWVTAEGEDIEATVLVCDIAGYTAHSERSSPAEMMELLREFFDIVQQTVEQHGGILARRPGDAAIVFFRPEAGQPHHARRAVEAALALQRRLAELWRDRPIGFGITLTTGPVSLGFVGPEPQILGDPVNVAFRLQQECRRLGRPVIADWATATADEETAKLMRPLGQVSVRHRSQPVHLFAPVQDHASNAPPDQ